MLEIRHQGMEELAATRSAYDEIYQREAILLRDSFYLWLIELLDAQPGRRLLDISTGAGRLVVLARRLGLHASGVDFSLAGLRLGQKQSPEASWVVGDGECLPLAPASVDYITHIGSLEHYLHPRLGALEIARLLKPGGRACILVPNAFGLLGNIRHVLAKGDIFDDGQPLQRYATRRTWERLLAESGLRVQRVVGYAEIERPRTPEDWRWFLWRPMKVMRLALSALIPLNLSNHFVFLCTPA